MRRVIAACLQVEPAKGNKGSTTTCIWQLFSWNLHGFLIIDWQICAVQNLIKFFLLVKHTKIYFFILALFLWVSQEEWETLESLPSHVTGKLKIATELRGEHPESRKRPTITWTLEATQCWSDAELLHVISLSFHLITIDNIMKKIHP